MMSYIFTLLSIINLLLTRVFTAELWNIIPSVECEVVIETHEKTAVMKCYSLCFEHSNCTMFSIDTRTLVCSICKSRNYIKNGSGFSTIYQLLLQKEDKEVKIVSTTQQASTGKEVDVTTSSFETSAKVISNELSSTSATEPQTTTACSTVKTATTSTDLKASSTKTTAIVKSTTTTPIITSATIITTPASTASTTEIISTAPKKDIIAWRMLLKENKLTSRPSIRLSTHISLTEITFCFGLKVESMDQTVRIVQFSDISTVLCDGINLYLSDGKMVATANTKDIDLNIGLSENEIYMICVRINFATKEMSLIMKKIGNDLPSIIEPTSIDIPGSFKFNQILLGARLYDSGSMCGYEYKSKMLLGIIFNLNIWNFVFSNETVGNIQAGGNIDETPIIKWGQFLEKESNNYRQKIKFNIEF